MSTTKPRELKVWEIHNLIDDCIDDVEKYTLLLKGETDEDFIKDIQGHMEYCEMLIDMGHKVLDEIFEDEDFDNPELALELLPYDTIMEFVRG